MSKTKAEVERDEAIRLRDIYLGEKLGIGKWLEETRDECDKLRAELRAAVEGLRPMASAVGISAAYVPNDAVHAARAIVAAYDAKHPEDK